VAPEGFSVHTGQHRRNPAEVGIPWHQVGRRREELLIQMHEA